MTFFVLFRKSVDRFVVRDIYTRARQWYHFPTTVRRPQTQYQGVDTGSGLRREIGQHLGRWQLLAMNVRGIKIDARRA
ncbi:hypothetical protein [Sphingomonas sp. PAMC 26605]|uniref:hypothetical protein n=1 Tax=Sphingomonas sp. PAMC 26605 TaxID=1112214 RepID=UPI0012F49797|nr:hypothetical protein [Sphingomonas sp. PAMC 26605]